MNFGSRLSEVRAQLRLSQADIAQRCGVSREMWGKYERRIAMPGGDVLARLALVGADVPYILTGVPSDPAVLASWRAVVEHTQHADISTAARQRLMAMAGAGMAQPDAGAAPRSARQALSVAEPAHAYAATVGPDARLLSSLRRCSDTDQAMIRALIERLAKTEENNDVADVDD